MARRRKGLPISGWLVLDKPAGLTSTAAVNRVRHLLGAAKAGHAGTLDPIATGVLPIAFGEATKTMSFALDRDKAYRFTVRWGEGRDTDDLEGAVTATSPKRPTRDEIEAALPDFLGVIEQAPPAFSAIKVQGERAYALARAGQPVDLAPRPVRIDALRLLETPDPDTAVLEVACGKGAYVRSLARDLARRLGTVGHLASIRRLKVGPFSLDAAVTLPHLEELAGRPAPDAPGEAGTPGPDLRTLLLPVETPLDDIPAVALTEAEAHRLRRGQAVALLRRSDRDRLERLLAGRDGTDTLVLAVTNDTPVALARIQGVEVHPVRVLNL